MKNILLVSILAILQVSAIEQQRHGVADIPEYVSMMQLIATPEKYDGKLVEVTGFLRLEFEGHAIYFHKTDYENALTKNAIWVVRNAILDQNADTLDMHYVILTGRFDAANKGHMSQNSGAIKEIISVGLWPPRPITPDH
jgi:hypothetical protein